LIVLSHPHHSRSAIRPEKTELELTGGPLSDLFDRFFRYVPRSLSDLFAGNKYGTKFADIDTFFTRGTKDHVVLEDLPDAAAVLPDGRFILSAMAKREGREGKSNERIDLSLVRTRWRRAHSRPAQPGVY
jgi:hypothetical protein